jgi:hypothetical protein
MYPIEVDGRTFQVRENLWWFLYYVAAGRIPYHLGPDTSCYLWIDQLCIDQASNKEKNHQVRLMSDIYREAREVVVWLGKETGESTTCMSFLAQAPTLFQAQFEDPFYDRLDPEARFGVRFRRALDTLSQQSYWSRLWIIQEFALAKRLTLTWGESQLSLVESGFRQVLFEAFRANRADHILFRLCQLRDQVQEAGPIGLNRPLIEICLQFMDSDCTDQRDVFYGLIGLVSKDQRISVDYSRRAEDVFWDAVSAQHLIDASHVDHAVDIKARLGALLRRLNIAGTEAGGSQERALCNLCTLYPGIINPFDMKQTRVSITQVCKHICVDSVKKRILNVPRAWRTTANGYCFCGELKPGTSTRRRHLKKLQKRRKNDSRAIQGPMTNPLSSGTRQDAQSEPHPGRATGLSTNHIRPRE